MVLLPIVLFFGWVTTEVHWAVVLVGSIVCAVTYLALITTGLKNPGVVERCAARPIPELCALSHNDACPASTTVGCNDHVVNHAGGHGLER